MNADLDLLNKLRYITEKSAVACSDWIGRGDKNAADKAAVKVMREEINNLGIRAEVLIGEGEKDEAPLLYRGEKFGSGSPEWHIAVDPLEGTTNLAKGLANSMSVISLCEVGKMFDPGNSFYMNKIAGAAELKGKIDPNWEISQIITTTSKILNKPINEVNVFVLDKPRHKELIHQIYSAGAKVSLYSAGDVAGAILAALPGTSIDLLIGIGGTPEGLLSACAVKSIGGEFIGRLAPQLPSEIIELKEQGLNTDLWYPVDELIQSDKVFFSATGITDSRLFKGIKIATKYIQSETLCLHGINNDLLLIKSFQNT